MEQDHDRTVHDLVKRFLGNEFAENEMKIYIGDHAHLESMIDCIWLYACNDAHISRLAELVKLITSHKPSVVPTCLMHLEPALLEAAGLIDSAVIMNRRLVRANTNLYYRQAKYNVFSEEPEGWCRLISAMSSAESRDVVLKLIGEFGLDPNRVVDCLLDAAASSIPNHAGLLALLESFGYPSERICEVIGIKLFDPLETNYYLIFAVLIKKGVILLQDLLGYLPEHAIGRHHLPMVKPPQSSDPFGFHNVSSVIAEQSVSQDPRALLLDALLRTDQLDLAKSLISTFGPLYAIHSPSWVTISALLEYHLSGVINDDEHFLHISCMISAEFTYWLSLMKERICVSVPLMSKLLKRLDGGDVSVFMDCCLPAASLCPPCPPVAYQLHAFLARFDYQQRFSFYHRWLHWLLNDRHHGQISSSINSMDIKRLMRRLSKENVKLLGRLLGKLGHLNPLPIFMVIIDQIKAYDNMIQPVVEAVRFCGPFALDILAFLICREFLTVNAGCERVKTDGVNAADWLQRLAVFNASLAKRYVFDLEPVFEVILQRLCVSGDELPIFTEILKKMAGVEVNLSSVNENVLEASFGGRVLVGVTLTETVSAADQRVLQKAMGRLVNVLNKPLGHSTYLQHLLNSLSRQPHLAVYKCSFSALKAQSHAFDQTIEVFALFLEFLQKARLSHEIAKPDLDSLPLLFSSWVGRVFDAQRERSFWKMSIQDIYCPKERYEQELSKLKQSACNPALKQKEREDALSDAMNLEAEMREALERIGLEIEEEVLDYKSILMRAILTPLDAVYTAKYCLKRAIYCPELLNLEALLPVFSEREAICYGRFLNLLLAHLNQSLADMSNVDIFRQHIQMYRHLHSALVSSDFILLRNSILLLTRLDGQFPVFASIGAALELAVRSVHEHEAREDLKVLATRCQAILQTARPRWVDPMIPSVENSSDEELDELTEAFREISSKTPQSAEATEGGVDVGTAASAGTHTSTGLNADCTNESGGATAESRKRRSQSPVQPTNKRHHDSHSYRPSDARDDRWHRDGQRDWERGRYAARDRDRTRERDRSYRR